jgi:hypothetical protein
MRSLLRLAGWGIAATAAMMVAVLVANTGNGQQRLSVAVAAMTGKATTKLAKAPPPDRQLPDPVQLARLAATENETRRLNEMVRSLSTDRQRLQTRLSALERNLEDVTGSIRRQAAAPPPPPSAAPPLVQTVPPPAAPVPAVAAPVAVPPQPPAPSSEAPPSAQPPARVANVAPAASPAEAETPPPESSPPVGVDIGGAPTFDGLRALWKSVTSGHASLFDGLHPVVGVRENSKARAADLRLVVGPLADRAVAGRICTALTAAKRYCRPVAFEGRPLALAAPEQPRRPKAAPERKPPPRPPSFFGQ